MSISMRGIFPHSFFRHFPSVSSLYTFSSFITGNFSPPLIFKWFKNADIVLKKA